MRRNAVLVHAVHFLGTNLNLEGTRRRANDRRVQRLVHVELGHRDVVLEAPRDGMPQVVNGTQTRIALGDGIDDDAQTDEVVNLREALFLLLHLLVDGVQVLGTAVYLRVCEAHAVEFLAQCLHGLGEVFLACLARLVDHLLDLLVFGRFEIEERKVLELPFDRAHAEAIGERRVYLHGLACLEEAAILAQRHERAHVMKSVGELDDDDANVVAHRHEHLAQVIDLRMAEGLDLEAVDLGDAVHELCDRIAKLLAYVVKRVLGILDRVMQDRGAQGVAVHAQIGEDDGNLDRMHDERLAGFAELALVSILGKEVCFLDCLAILIGQIYGRILDEYIDAIGCRLILCLCRYALLVAHVNHLLYILCAFDLIVRQNGAIEPLE